MAPPLVDIVRHTMFLPEAQRIPAVADEARRRFGQLLDVLEPALAGREHLCGEFTAADIMVGYALRLGGMFGLTGDGHGNVQAYFGRLAARPAYERATG
jgi:glutathione S-transferase